MSKPKETNVKQENAMFGAGNNKNKQAANDWRVKSKDDSMNVRKSDEKDTKGSNSWGPVFKNRDHFNQLHHF